MVSPSLFGLDYGSSIRVRSEIRALAELGVQLSLCAYSVKGSDNDGRMYRIPFVPSFVKPGPTFHRAYLDPQLAIVATRATAQNHPHLIHSHLNEGPLVSALAKKTSRVPLVMDLQGSITSEVLFSGMLDGTNRAYRLLRYLERISFELADQIIVSSPVLKKIVESYGPRVPVTVVPDSVDPFLFSPRPKNLRILEKLNIPENHFLIVYLGSLGRVQGIDILLEAAKIALNSDDRLHFVVMGFPYEELYRELARKLGVSKHVSFTGRIPFEFAGDYLSIGDVAVSAKRNCSESNGKILNYMAMGLPSVIFENENNRFLAADSAIYSDSEDPKSLAEAILIARSDPNLRAMLAAKGAERARSEFSPHRQAERLVSVYSSLW